MVYTSQQFTVSSNSGQKHRQQVFERNNQDGAFLNIFNRSINSLEKAAVQRPSLRTDKPQPLQSTNQYRADNTTERTKSRKTSENSSGIYQDTDVELSTSDVSQTESKGLGKLQRVIANIPEDQGEETKIKKILGVMDEIMALLQKFHVFINEELKNNAGESDDQLILSETKELDIALKECINSLLAITDMSEGESVDTVKGFVEELQQMVEKGLAGLIEKNDEVSVDTCKLKELLEKMLYETSNAKIHITGEIEKKNINIDKKTGEIVSKGDSIISESKDNRDVQDVKQNHRASEGSNEEPNKQKNNNETTRSGVVNTLNGTKGVNTEFQAFSPPANECVDSVQENEPAYTDIFKPQSSMETEVLQQVVEKAELLSDSDKSEIVMQLKPDNLGKIHLRVIQERGEIVAKFMAENEQVKSVLESNMQFLKDSLEKSGVEIQSLSVSVGQHDNSSENGDFQGRYEQNRQHRVVVDGPSVEPTVNETYRYGGLAGDLYGLRESEINLTA